MSEKFIIPVSIIIAGIVIGGAFFVANKKQSAVDNTTEIPEVKNEVSKVSLEEDHIFGNPNAELFVIEYSDLECPFCKRYFDVTKKLKADYLKDGKVAFVWRNFPLYKPINGRIPHASAGKEAVAAECVAEISGNDKFFEFVGKIFETSKSDGNYPLETLPALASSIGVNEQEFTACYNSDRMTKVIESQYQSAISAGIESTPSVFVQTKSGENFKGTPDYLVLKTAIDAYLSELPNIHDSETNQTSIAE